MVRVFFGKKGMGKTKLLIDEANNLTRNGSGDVVFIDDSNQLIYNLERKVRFINVSEFPVNSSESFLGFVCGIISEDYDIEGIFIDGLTYITKQEADSLQGFFTSIKDLASKYNISFYITVNGDPEQVPEYIKGFMA